MPTSGYSSPMANIIAKRSQLAAVRQKIGLEGSNMTPQGTMNPASPTPPALPPKAVVGPQAEAVMGQTPMPEAGPGGMMPMHPRGFMPVPPEPEPVPGQEGQQPTSIPTDLHPDARNEMLSRVGSFLDKHAPRQQAMIDQERRQQGAVGPTGNPIKDFQAQTGRLPSPQEALVLGAQNRLRQQLGRDPSDQEVEAYFTPQEKANAAPATV